MCGNALKRELFLSAMIFLAEAKMRSALMNSLTASICGLANLSALSVMFEYQVLC